MTTQLPLFVDGKRRRRPPPAPERRTHIAVVDLLRRFAKPDWYFVHLPMGEHRSKATGRLLQRMGAKPGLPDLMLISPQGVPHFLELKRGHLGRLTDSQAAFRDLCQARSIPWCLACSFDEAIAQFDAWGVLKPGVRVQ